LLGEKGWRLVTATLDGVTKKKTDEQSAEAKAAVELVRLAKEQGLSLTGPDGLLKQLTKTVLETALNEEMTEHLGYEKHDPAGAGTGNIRNGTRAKTVLTEHSGPVVIDTPRDRAATFEPTIVRKRQRRLNGVDEVVLSLYAKGLTTGEVSAHFAEIYGASVNKEPVSRITDKVLEEMNDWSVRLLDGVYAAIFIDAIVVKVRDGQVANRPVLCGDRGQPGRGAGHSRAVGRQRWRGREVLDGGAHRPAQPRDHGHVLRGLRRPQGSARSRRKRAAVRDRADLHHPLDPQHLPADLPHVLGRDQTGT
jgi:Transposase, Mutator family